MSSPEIILRVLRSEIRHAGITYRTLSERVGLSESSVKRIFSDGDMSLSRLALICKAAGLSMEHVLRQAADAAPHADTLTLVQEKALILEPKLLLVAICCIGQWSFEQIIETYELSEAECVTCLVKLDRLGLVELRPLNKYRMRVSRAFRWRPDGPVQHYFRNHVVDDYFSGRFDGAGETLLCVHARLSQPSAIELVHKIQQLSGELARLHESDQRLAAGDRDGYTLVLGLRSWEFNAFTAMRRQAAQAGAQRLPAILPN